MALGANFVSYADALNKAHNEHGLRGIDTELVQIPTPENERVAIVTAVVKTEKGEFKGLGDATPYEDKSYKPEQGQLGNKPVATATIRMAETRAKARGLRDAINLGSPVEGDIADEADSILSQEQFDKIVELAGKVPTLGSLEAFEEAIKQDPATLGSQEAASWIRRLNYRAGQAEKEAAAA